MTNPAEKFLTQSLQESPAGLKTARILAAALAAVDPAALIKQQVERSENALEIQDRVIDLDTFQRIILLGIGKAALPMSRAAAELLGERTSQGLALTKMGGNQPPEAFPAPLTVYTGSHPLPDRSSLKAGKAILKRVSSLSENDLVVVLLSGGGSALLSVPAPGLKLEDLVATNQLLLDCGANIQEINTVRKHISAVKGGRLAEAIFPASTLTLILSDVMGDRLDSIASGLTVPDPTTYQDALDIAASYQLSLPDRVQDHLEKGAQGLHPETLKPGHPIFLKTISLLIGSNQDACRAAASQAKTEGFQTAIHPDPLQGEAASVGVEMAQLLREMALDDQPLPRPACLIAGGETTVNLTNSDLAGEGGRNLELALSAVEELSGLENCAFISLATDGEDGTTDAAGAVVTGDSLSRAQKLQLEPAAYLEAHNSYPFFSTLDDLVMTGPTGTNVNDLCVLFTYK